MRVIRGDYYRAGADPRIEGQGSFFFNNCDLAPEGSGRRGGLQCGPWRQGVGPYGGTAHPLNRRWGNAFRVSM